MLQSHFAAGGIVKAVSLGRELVPTCPFVEALVALEPISKRKISESRGDRLALTTCTGYLDRCGAGVEVVGQAFGNAWSKTEWRC